MARLARTIAAAAMFAAPGIAVADPVAADYCANIADKAADARVAWQTANLRKLETEVAAKLSALDAREAELKDWVGKRDAMVKAASRELVDIYAKMDTEAAAAQLAKVETVTATSILRQLSPRAAGAILAVMDAERAATLVRMIAAPTKDLPPGGGT